MGASESTAWSRGRQKQSDGTVRVWSEVGLTLPVDDTTAHIRFLFGHERLAKNDTQAEIRKTEKLIDEFNERTVSDKVEKYTRLIRSLQAAAQEDDGGTRSRARRKARENIDAKR